MFDALLPSRENTTLLPQFGQRHHAAKIAQDDPERGRSTFGGFHLQDRRRADSAT